MYPFEHTIQHWLANPLEMILEIIERTTGGLWGIAVYVATAYALYYIAKRRGIRNPWLAWIPVVQAWILGSLSDQYQYLVRNQVKNRRKILLILNIILASVVLVFIVVFLVILALIFMAAAADADALGWGAVALTVVFALAYMGVAIAQIVVRFQALYDIYRSCQPEHATLFLVLSIFVSPAIPVILIIIRDKDLGMPPRKQAAAEPLQPPQWTSQNRGPEL